MTRHLIRRRLVEVGDRIRRLRSEIAIAEEQSAHLEHEAEEARVRALVSETAIGDRERRGAERHAQRMAKHRDELFREVRRLEAMQDRFLDQLNDGD